MKILQIVPYFYPAWAYGGPGKLVYDTSSYFASKGHRVTVCTSDAYDENVRMPEKLKIRKKNLNVKYFTNFNNYLTYHYNIFFTPRFFYDVTFWIKKYDIVHIHDFYTLQNFYLGFLCRIFDVPYILSVHGCLEEKRIAQRSLFKKIFLWIYGYQLLRHASAVIATSENEVKAYQAYGINADKIYLLGHGIVSSEFETKLNKKQSRTKLNLPQSKMIITYLGRIHKIKGLDRLIEAINMLKKDDKLHFVIAGSDDGYLEELKNLIRKNELENKITLLGTCFGEQKAQLFKASDIFIYPSYSEGFSLGILEAASAGLPMILSTGCHFDLVQKTKAGLVVVNSPKKLAQAISQVAKNKTKMAIFSKNARLLVDENYSMAKIGDDLIDIYEKVV